VNATVVLVPDPPRREHQRLYREASADQFAHFVVENVTPGKYHAFAWEEVSWEDFTDPDFLREYEPKGEAVLIGENEKKTFQLTLISDSDNKK
jgi:non-ribosomal peptide synthetase component F